MFLSQWRAYVCALLSLAVALHVCVNALLSLGVAFQISEPAAEPRARRSEDVDPGNADPGNADPGNADPFCISDRKIPQLYLLGEQKAGTTFIAEHFQEAGFVSGRKGEKELHSFNRLCGFLMSSSRSKGVALGMINMTGCPDEFKAHDKSFWLKKFDQKCSEPMVMDCTPDNIRMPNLPGYMHSIYGKGSQQLRFAVVLREPISRLQSGYYQAAKNSNYQRPPYWMTNWRKKKPAFTSFQDYVHKVRDSGRLQSFREKGWKGVENDYLLDFVYRSLYGLQLQKWFSVFSARQFIVAARLKVIRSVDGLRDFTEVVAKSVGAKVDTAKITEVKKIKNHHYPTLDQDLDKKTIQWLQEDIFKPDIIELSRLLAKSVDEGMLLYGYKGNASADHIFEFMTTNW